MCASALALYSTSASSSSASLVGTEPFSINLCENSYAIAMYKLVSLEVKQTTN